MPRLVSLWEQLFTGQGEWLLSIAQRLDQYLQAHQQRDAQHCILLPGDPAGDSFGHGTRTLDPNAHAVVEVEIPANGLQVCKSQGIGRA